MKNKLKALAYALILATCASVAYGKTLKLNSKNLVFLEGRIDNSSANKVINDLLRKHFLRKSGKANYPIYLYINTYGGGVYATQNIVNAAISIGNVHTICRLCFSGGHLLTQLIPGKRYIVEGGLTGSHRFLSGFPMGNLPTIKKSLGEREKENHYIYKKIAKRLGLTVKKYLDIVELETFYNTDSALKLNFMDDVVNLSCSWVLFKSTRTSTVRNRFGMPMKIKKSACPLVP